MPNAILGECILGKMLIGNSTQSNWYGYNHADRMLNYYPEVIKSILEFKAITNTDGVEFDEIQCGLEHVIDNAYLTTMMEDRIMVWENVLGIQPLEGTTFDDRRATIIARIRGQGKLNTALINSIVNAFTGGTANSWVENSVLYVEITPPPNNKEFVFENVEQELKQKIPAHLGFNVSRAYSTWGDLKNRFNTWNDVKTDLGTWESVYLLVPTKRGE